AHHPPTTPTAAGTARASTPGPAATATTCPPRSPRSSPTSSNASRDGHGASEPHSVSDTADAGSAAPITSAPPTGRCQTPSSRSQTYSLRLQAEADLVGHQAAGAGEHPAVAAALDEAGELVAVERVRGHA